MNTKNHTFLISLYSLLFFLTPLIFTPFTDELFEFPKMIFVYGIMIVVIAFYIVKIIWQKKIVVKKTPLNLALLLIFISTLISTLFSTHFLTSFYGYYSRFNGNFLSITGYIFLAFIFVQEFNEKETKEFLKTLIASAFITSIYAIFQKLGIDKNYWVQHSWERVFSTLGQPNWLASFLVMLFPINFVLFSSELKTVRKTKHYLSLFFLFISCIFLSLALLFTRSASGYLAFLIVFLGLITYYLLTLSPKAKTIGCVILGVFVTVFCIFISLYPYNLSSLLTKETNEIRLIAWQGTLDMISSKPLWGYGLETYPYEFLPYRPEKLNYTSEWNFLFNKPHNEYLEILAESGIIGFATYLFFISMLMLWLHKRRKTIKNKELIVGIFLGFVGLLITIFFGFQVVTTNLLFFLFPMFILVLSRENFPTNTYKIQISPNIQVALSFFSITLALLGFMTIGRWFIANIYYNHGSISSLQKAVDLTTFENTYQRRLAFSLAKTAESKEEVDQALIQIREAYENNPRNYLALQTLAKSYLELADNNRLTLEYAYKLSKEQVQLAPTDPEAWYTQGLILITMNKKETAQDCLKKALLLKTDYTEAQEALTSLEE